MSDSTLIFTKEVVAIVIVGTDHDCNRFILFDCDVGNRHPFRLIGGKVDSTDLSLQTAIIREVNEEIGENTDTEVITISSEPAVTISTRKISGSSGLLTDYTIHVFTPLSYAVANKFSYSGVSGRRIIWMKLSTFTMLMNRVPDLFFRQTISDRVIEYINQTKTLYHLTPQELSFSM